MGGAGGGGLGWLCRKSSANRLVSKDSFLKSFDWSSLFIFSETVCQFSFSAKCTGCVLVPVITIVHNIMA